MARLFVGSRKGLLSFMQSGGNWALERCSFVGEPVSAVLSDPRDGTLYAALNLGHFGVKLHRSEDAGASWQELPAPAYPAQESNAGDDEKAPSVELIWTLAGGGPDRPGTLWAGTIPGGLFHSSDRGESWSLVESLWSVPERAQWFGGGYDQPGIHSIVLDPRDSARMTLAVSCGGIWRSADAGATWTLAGAGLKADYMPPSDRDERAVQDPHRIVLCPNAPEVVWCQHHCGIFLSRDGAETFEKIETARPSGFGFAVAVHPEDPETAWFAPAVKDECRVPVDQQFVVSRTRDGGASFEAFDAGLPPPPAFDLVYRHGLEIDAAGKHLAMGSTTGSLWIGHEQGTRWQLVGGNLPPIAQVHWQAA